MTRVVCISDTHTLQKDIQHPIPDGDILIHAGDMCSSGRYANEVDDFVQWFANLPHKNKVFIAGNHDWPFQKERSIAEGYVAAENQRRGMSGLPKNIYYLRDDHVILNGLKIYGSPWQPEFCNWAFNLPRGEIIKRVWDAIPEDTDILITHGPPFGILDSSPGVCGHVGCQDLRNRVEEIKPKVHVFGHIHGGYGLKCEGDTVFVNASLTNERYDPVHKPIIVDL